MTNNCYHLEGLMSFSNISLKPLKPNLVSKLKPIGQKTTITEWKLLMINNRIFNESKCSRVKYFNLKSIIGFVLNHSLIKWLSL